MAVETIGYSAADVAATHELARIAHRIRDVKGITNVDLDIDGSGSSARLWFDSSEWNEHTRGTTIAETVTHVAQGEHWDVTTVSDAVETGDTVLSVSVTVRRLEDADGGSRWE